MDNRIPINRCLNKELKYYGLKATGLIFGAVVWLLLLIKFNFTIAIIGCTSGYLLGAGISTYWSKGYIQRWCYWNLPNGIMRGSRKLPKSSERTYL